MLHARTATIFMYNVVAKVLVDGLKKESSLAIEYRRYQLSSEKNPNFAEKYKFLSVFVTYSRQN
jgi:hypothetical protein